MFYIIYFGRLFFFTGSRALRFRRSFRFRRGLCLGISNICFVIACLTRNLLGSQGLRFRVMHGMTFIRGSRLRRSLRFRRRFVWKVGLHSAVTNCVIKNVDVSIRGDCATI